MTKIWNVCTLCLRWKMENPSFFNAKFNQQTYNIYCYNSETLLIWDIIFLLSSFFNCFPVLWWAKSIVVREVLLMTLLMGRDCWPQWATPLLTSRVNWIIRLMACWMSSKLGTITCGKKKWVPGAPSTDKPTPLTVTIPAPFWVGKASAGPVEVCFKERDIRGRQAADLGFFKPSHSTHACRKKGQARYMSSLPWEGGWMQACACVACPWGRKTEKAILPRFWRQFFQMCQISIEAVLQKARLCTTSVRWAINHSCLALTLGSSQNAPPSSWWLGPPHAHKQQEGWW